MKTTKNISYDFVLPFFCADDNLRPAMCQVSMTDNNTVCASDGHKVISIPTDLCVKEYDKVEKYPNVENVLKEHRSNIYKEFLINTEDFLHVLSHAKWIKRTPGTSKCPDCNGDGKDTCHACGHSHKCESCEGTGTYQKDAIEFGLLQTVERYSVTILDRYFNAEHLHTIAVTAKILEAENIRMKITNKASSLFYFAGVELLLMTMCEPNLNEIKFSTKLLIETK